MAALVPALPNLDAAAIVAVGSELLTPFRTDTNSATIATRLEEIGISIVHKAIVPDSEDAVALAVSEAMARAGLVIVSGGLGPTSDDLTREGIASALGITLTEDADLVEVIRQRFARRGLEMPAINRRQAMVPEGGVPLNNPNGSAPGLLIARADVTIVALPGPPRELMPMLDALTAGTLRSRSAGTPVRRRVLGIAGHGESAVDEIAAPIYLPFATGPVPVETTILAKPGQVELHLSCRHRDTVAADAVLDEAARALERALSPACFTTAGASLEEVVGTLLTERGLWVATAESCTGGLVASRLTDVAGSSAYMRGGIVAYDNQVKVASLDVDSALIDAHGAVSEPVARAMADGARVRLQADVAVAITGIAGPGGGTPDKPVGTVAIAATGLGRERVRTFLFNGDRRLVRAQSVTAALEALRRLLLD